MIANFILALLVFSICFFGSDKSKGLKWAFVLIILFLSLRYDWGNDYPGYLKSFIDVQNTNFGLFDFKNMIGYERHNEIGWLFINVLFGKTLGFFGLIMALSIFENAVIYRFIKRFVSPEHYWMAASIYVFSTGIFAVGASMLRQFLAICIFLIVIELMQEKNIKKIIISLILILIAQSIHKSAVVLFLAMPVFFLDFNMKEGNYKWPIFILVAYIAWAQVAANVFGNSLDAIFAIEDFEEYNYYAREGLSNVENSLGPGNIFHYVFIGTVLFLMPKMEVWEKRLVVLYIVSDFVLAASGILPVAGRIGMYFSILVIVIWPIVFKYIKIGTYSNLLLLGQFAILLKTFWEFFHSEVWVEHFYTYQTILSASSWL